MKNYLFDTNILLLCIRADKRWKAIQEKLDLENAYNFISIVTVGEIWSLAYQNNWGVNRMNEMRLILEQFIILDINTDDIVQNYARTDAYSQGKLKDRPLKTTSRNMGKNDLWIAATAITYNIPLITTDADFDHLDGLLQLERAGF